MFFPDTTYFIVLGPSRETVTYGSEKVLPPLQANRSLHSTILKTQQSLRSCHKTETLVDLTYNSYHAQMLQPPFYLPVKACIF